MRLLGLHRLLYRRRVAGSALLACWNKPLPSPGTDWRRVPFLVVDAEMSSLDVGEGELLSVGWVCVDGGSIELSSARHYLVKARNSVGQSATIHNLRDCEFGDALPGAQVLRLFLEAVAGRVLVAHNAELDLAYLNRVSLREFRAPVLVPVVDTLRQEHALLTRRECPIKSGDLRLQACRARYNLPSYTAHNALLDALATAELLIAMAAHRSAGQHFPVRKLF
jgi:DNA polymerase-3 subunit epsilon